MIFFIRILRVEAHEQQTPRRIHILVPKTFPCEVHSRKFRNELVYEFSISNRDTRSEGYYGKLSFAGRPIPEPAEVNDHIRSPWGLMYWSGNPVVAFGSHGWMPRPRPSDPAGKLVQPPGPPVDALAAGSGVRPEHSKTRQSTIRVADRCNTCKGTGRVDEVKD